MASVRLAVERLRANGVLPIGGEIRVLDLHQRFQPTPKGSTRALVSKMFGSAAKKLPFAVLLCRFKGLPGDPTIERFYRGIFARGSGGLVEYWGDVSLGAVDISGTQVFGWLELDWTRAEAGGAGKLQRKKLIDHAKAVAKRNGAPLEKFYGVIAVFTHRWSKNGIPPGEPTWEAGDPMAPYYPFWIEGSASGRDVGQTPPFSGNVLAHEIGHTFSMRHDFGADLTTDYADPCCIMSQHNSFTHPTWNAFGPALCLPHLIQRGWMFNHRVYHDTGGWLSRSEGVTVPLAAIADLSARANLGLRLTYRNQGTAWDYFVEYMRPIEWNRGLTEPLIIIRRIAKFEGAGDTVFYLGQVTLPEGHGFRNFIDTDTKIEFRVYRFGNDDRIVKLHVRDAS
jgi:hypothetical protein